MAITYTYTITKLWASPEEVNGFSDVVLNIFFDITATDSSTGTTGVFSGVANIEPPEEGAINFVSYSSLTEQQIIQWLKTSLGLSQLEPMEAQAAQSIKQPSALPWI